MTKAEKLKMCSGCRNDFYNGKNPYDIKECWSLKTAKVKMRKRVAMDERPPWTRKPEKMLSCYRQKGFVFVEPGRNC